MPKIIKKFSVEEDSQLRLLVKAAMALIEKRNVDIARDLQYGSGAISGWLSGTPERLSSERKNLLAEYLGIHNGTLSPNIYHIWRTSLNNLRTYLPLLLPSSNDYTFHKIYSEDVPYGMLMKSKSQNVTVVVLPKHHAIDPFSLVPERYFDRVGHDIYINKDVAKAINSGGSKIRREDIFIKYNEDATGFKEEILARKVSNANKEEINRSIKAWMFVVVDCIDKGISAESARKKLEI
jgi:hypothetical protein